MKEDSIPRKIHYCWFGGNPLPELAQKCIASWRKYCPDYEIIEWNESNFDVHCCAYVQEAYEAGMWAFVSDYARFRILYENGGLYFDTDVEIIRPLDDILAAGPFMGLEVADEPAVNPGLGLAAPAGMDIYKRVLDDYHSSHFQLDRYGAKMTVVERTTRVLEQFGGIDTERIVHLAGVNIYPVEYFCPMDYRSGKVRLTANTRTIHYFTGTWLTATQKSIQRIETAFWGRGALAQRVGWLISLPWRLKDHVEQIGTKATALLIWERVRRGGVTHREEIGCYRPAFAGDGGAA